MGSLADGLNGVLSVIKPSHANPSLQMTADHQVKMQEAPVSEPGPGEALVHIKTTGICGSDIHFWKTGRIGSLVVEGDCILGHEAAGIVLKCGPGVTDLEPGDRVAVEPGVPCGTCFLCMEGRYNLCESVQFAGVYPYHGTLQRYKAHPARWLHKIPDNVSFAEAALLEPLSVVLHGIEIARLSLGHPVLICGAGPIGLIALAAARASGAHPIVKYVPGCLTYHVQPTLSGEQHATKIRELFGAAHDPYFAPRAVLECTGVESSVIAACYAVRRGGTVVVIGVGKSIMNNLPFMHISLSEIDLKFVNRYRDTWPAGISCLSGGIISLRELVTHTFPLEKAIDALCVCPDTGNGSIKVQIVDEARDALSVPICTVLCAMEMMSASAQDWRKHLEGCAALFDAFHVHDLCGALMSDGTQSTLVPPAKWLAPGTDDIAARDLFREAKSQDAHANYAVYLCANVCELVAAARGSSSWGWVDDRCPEMLPVQTVETQPFPQILFTQWAAISSNQLYHTACILLLQSMAAVGVRAFPSEAASATGHARRVCGSSLTNPHQGCLNNAIQPLWVAGRLLSHRSEHTLVVKLIREIETMSGWAACWRIPDLEVVWGYKVSR